MSDTAASGDPLIAALIAKLPPTDKPWPRAARMNWLRLMVMAFNETYGLEEPVFVIDIDQRTPAPTRPPLRLVPVDDAPAAGVQDVKDGGLPQQLYVIDEDGFAMRGVSPIGPGDIPAGQVLWDRRRPGEQLDLETIMWKGVGAIAADKLPRLDVRAA